MEPLTVDPSSAQPPFEQLRTQIATRVAEGTLPAGAKLPTVRRLAEDLGLAANTVARAYRELEADGVIATEGRRGSFVRSRTLEPGQDGEVREAAASYVAAARRHGLGLAEATRMLERSWSPADQ
jgi:DNA-binding transcriptional regulator YhcF (GntR family)